MYDIPPLHANKLSKTGSAVAVGISGHVVRWLQQIQFASATKYEAECFEFGGALGLSGGPDVVVIDPPVLYDLELLFERDSR